LLPGERLLPRMWLVPPGLVGAESLARRIGSFGHLVLCHWQLDGSSQEEAQTPHRGVEAITEPEVEHPGVLLAVHGSDPFLAVHRRALLAVLALHGGSLSCPAPSPLAPHSWRDPFLVGFTGARPSPCPARPSCRALVLGDASSAIPSWQFTGAPLALLHGDSLSCPELPPSTRSWHDSFPACLSSSTGASFLAHRPPAEHSFLAMRSTSSCTVSCSRWR